MDLGAVYVLYNAYNNVTPTCCFDGSAEHSLAQLYVKLFLVFSECQDLLEEIYCLEMRLIISYNNKGSNNPYFPLTTNFNFSITI